jgi:hypothetical protein
MPEKTRRLHAITKMYQYHGVRSKDPRVNIELPIFRAKLINEAISYEQLQTRTGLSEEAVQMLTEFCETKQASPRDVEYIKRWKKHLSRIFGFNECDFDMAVYEVDDTDWRLVEV